MTHYASLIATLVTLLTVAILLSSKIGKKIKDVPNERSLHDVPIPRIGGAGLMAGMLSAWALMLMSLAWWVVLPLLVLFTVSLFDDIRGLPVRLRLLVHIVAAAILVFGSGMVAQSVLLALAVLLCVVWITNLYNFMDGSDGLAGGMTLFGFSMYGVAALVHGDETQAMLNFSIGAAALGFLYYNFPPAKVFMGDAGSIPLGFLAAAMGLWGWQRGCWPAWFPLLAFSPFVVDATITLLKRILRSEKLSQAHRSHYYQRLVQMGWGHRNTAIAEYALMFFAGVSALWGTGQGIVSKASLLALWGAIYLGLAVWIDYRWRLHGALTVR